MHVQTFYAGIQWRPRAPPKMGRLAPPTVKHTGQESGGELCEILIVSAVKICEQCLGDKVP